MSRREFVKLYEVLKERVENEGKCSPDRFLGYIEGFGNRKMTGYQVGALYYLLVLPSTVKSEHKEEVNEIVSEEQRKISVPGLF